ncbi:MAG: terpene cyclase/mutase family protein [Planctomycetes bacterium]|nr:terpene cyclase/mutase family protein [Planctomycetota bacterium]
MARRSRPVARPWGLVAAAAAGVALLVSPPGLGEEGAGASPPGPRKTPRPEELLPQPAPGEPGGAAGGATTPEAVSGGAPEGGAVARGAAGGEETSGDLLLPGGHHVTEEIRKAVERALDYLKGMQNGDGSFGQQHQVASTALCGLAFMAGGSLPRRGKYGDQVWRAMEYLVAQQAPSGYICEGGASGIGAASRIHGHGYATLFLSQVYGMDKQIRVRVRNKEVGLASVIREAVLLASGCQTEKGGWNYEPGGQYDENSTTVCVLQGLRAARDAGILVDRGVIQRADQYLHESAEKVQWKTKAGEAKEGFTFKYSLQMGGGGHSSFALVAGSVASLQAAGKADDPCLRGGLEFLYDFYTDKMEARPGGDGFERFFFYSHFYTAQAFYHADDPRMWNGYYPKAAREFLTQRRGDYWEDPMAGKAFGTAVAALILQIPYGYLPLFQK